jgi:hypothetical protein
MGDTPQLFSLLLQVFYLMRRELQRALELGMGEQQAMYSTRELGVMRLRTALGLGMRKQSLALAQRQQDPALLWLGNYLVRSGRAGPCL